MCLYLKWEKAYWIFEDRRTGKMMIINDINDNILISHPSYWGLYQYEAKNEISTKR